jgi:hypothetical protein
VNIQAEEVYGESIVVRGCPQTTSLDQAFKSFKEEDHPLQSR